MHDLVVIGGGLAGLTAGLFGARQGLDTLVLLPLIPGGCLATIDHIEDFPGFPEGIAGYDLGPRVQEQASNAGAAFQMAEVTGFANANGGWALTTVDGELEARAVVVASGSRPKPLGVPGEARLEGRGVSHCASCDGPLLRGKPVVVAGGGDSGLQEALALAAFDCEVTVVFPEASPAGQYVYRSRTNEHPRVTLLPGARVIEALGEDTLTGVRVHSANGERDLPAASLFVYAGLLPNTGFLTGLLPLAPDGRVPVDIDMATGIPGLFAAGAVRAGSAGQAVSAAGDGATAALAAARYLASAG